jgi:hypothetical protein
VVLGIKCSTSPACSHCLSWFRRDRWCCWRYRKSGPNNSLETKIEGNKGHTWECRVWGSRAKVLLLSSPYLSTKTWLTYSPRSEDFLKLKLGKY